MKKSSFIYLLTLLLAGCQDDMKTREDPSQDMQPGDYSEEVRGIYVGMGTRGDGWSIEDEYVQFADNVGPDEEKPYIITHFNKGDILFISQMGTTQDPTLYNMKTDENAKPDYSKETVKENLYIYQYRENQGADWNEGSNFVPYINVQNDSTPMNWSKIKNLGSVGNAFQFYALFQGNNQTPNCRTVAWMNYGDVWSNYPPHSAYELGTRYGLFGAYHATSSLYTRMRFRMYPLFNIMQVTLLIPVKEEDPTTGGYSGFDANVFKNNWRAGNSSAQRLPGLWFGVPIWYNDRSNTGISTSFNINWRANRSSDNEPPLISALTGNTNTSFYLLRYDINNPDAEHPEFRLDNVKKFYPAYKNENHPDEDYDMVRRYEFICYYVAQSTFSSSSFNALLSMRLLTPGSSGDLYYVANTTYPDPNHPMSVEGTYVPYFFYGNNKNQGQFTGGDVNLGLNTPGTYSHLTLYVPRKGNNTLLVSAKVVPWNNTHTDMTLIESDYNTDYQETE